jgi:hypothetical protein
LEQEAWRVDRARSRASRAKCPNGHKPGDPKCDLQCFITPLQPIDSPLFRATQDDGAAKKVTASATLHEWVTDDLKPVASVVDESSTPVVEGRQCAREFLNQRPKLTSLLFALRTTKWENDTNWPEFSRQMRELYRQFDVPKRYWWDRIPYVFGWWWRMVYGWWLSFVEINWEMKKHE